MARLTRRAGAAGRPRARLHRLHGRGQDDAPRGGWRERSAWRSSTPTRVDRRAHRHADRPLLRRAGRGGVPRASRSELVASCSSAPTAASISLGGGALHSERIRDALRRHITVLLDVDVNVAWERAAGRGAPARARPAGVPRPLPRRAARSTWRPADVVLPADAPRPRRRRAAVDPRAGDARRRARACCGRRAPPATTPCSSGAVCSARGSRRCPAQGFRRHRRAGRAALRRAPRRRWRRASRSRPASSTSRSRPPNACGSRWRERGMTQSDHVVALGGGVVGDLAGFVRGDLPARRAVRAGADDARRAGRLRLRRQDRRRPARGQELRRRLPPAAVGRRRRRHARRRCRARSSPPATPRSLKTALIAGGRPVGARAPRRRSRRST